ncbi:MAG: helix-turn-helix domain-containing protein [Wenzhouxiangella sp.]
MIYVGHFLDALPPEFGFGAELLHQMGLPPDHFDPDQRVPIEQVLALLEQVDRRALPGWHVAAALALEAAHHGPMGVAVASAPSVAAALDALARYEPLRFPFAALSCRHSGALWRARVLPLIEPEGPWDLLLEIHLLSLAGLVERVLGRQRSQLRLLMPPGYRAWQALLEKRFGERLRFEGRHYGLGLPLAALDQPSLLANRVMHRDAVTHCERLLAEPADSEPLLHALRSRLLATAAPFPSLEQMAKALCCSSRTLIRRLSRAGTSYRALVDETRQLRAYDLLRRSDLAVAEVAEQLGYRDVANFGRACRRWFGCSPGRLRHGQR